MSRVAITPDNQHAPKQAERVQSGAPKQSPETTVALLALVAIVVVAAYSSVLFNWFAGDDFVHLVWLKQAVHQPELIWRNFHANWLDVPTTKFYRPLISVFMTTDYLLWGTNGFGFHLTNVVFLLLGAFSLFFIVRALVPDVPTLQGRNACAFAAALIFGIYPLHPETVSWITGRVDGIVTAFSLLSFWCYVRWRQTKRAPSLILSLLSLVLALFSKEMALTVPCVCFTYDLLIASENSRTSLISKALLAAKNTATFWLTLAVYFIIRRLSLGTFVGGYDNSLFFISDVRHFILSWLHGLHMLIVPANRELMSSHNIFVIAWQAGLALSAALALLLCIKEPSIRRRTFFLLLWLGFSLAPVYKIFAISDDLQGSRLAFLATAPLSCLIALAALRFNESSKRSLRAVFSTLAIGVIAVSGFFILKQNNSAWAQAGAASNAIRSSLQHFYDVTPGDPQVLIAGLPDTIHGAYVVRNALPGMTTAPQLSRTVKNALMVNRIESVLPFGYCKRSMPQSLKDFQVLAWSMSDQELLHIDTASFSVPRVPFILEGDRLAHSLALEAGTCKLQPNADGSTEVVTTGARTQPMLKIVAPAFNCFNTDFIAVNATVVSPGDGSGVDVFYKDRIVPAYDLQHRVHSALPGPGSETTLLFSLHALPEWALGESGQIALRLPLSSDIKIHSIRTIAPDSLMPTLSFPNSGYLGTKGFGHLSQKDRALDLSYDAGMMPDAAQVALEITRPDLYFEDDLQNTGGESKVVGKRIICPSVKGTTRIERDMFTQEGLYELRPYALDRLGNRLGVAGDHIIISVDS